MHIFYANSNLTLLYLQWRILIGIFYFSQFVWYRKSYLYNIFCWVKCSQECCCWFVPLCVWRSRPAFDVETLGNACPYMKGQLILLGKRQCNWRQSHQKLIENKYFGTVSELLLSLVIVIWWGVLFHTQACVLLKWKPTHLNIFIMRQFYSKSMNIMSLCILFKLMKQLRRGSQSY